MAETEVGNEILNVFGAMGGAFKIAGRNKCYEDVAKKGYVGFTKPEAVAAFHANPEYVDWTCKFVDGEYRFFPPENKKQAILAALNGAKKSEEKQEEVVKKEVPVNMETKDVVETYKRTIADPTKTSFVAITTLQDDPSKCRYRLLTTDKKTGEQTIVQDFVMDFEGKFSMEILPSIYNQLMGGLPVMDRERGEENQKSIVFQSIESDKIMAFSNLRESQLALIASMKKFVDSKYFDAPEERRGMHK